jgi:hypothetical protein
MSQTLNDVKNSTVRVLGDGKFSGTGFFITEEYCVTCHHVICDHDEIKIEHEQREYNTKWIEEYSVLENDIAILKVNKANALPLKCAKEATPHVRVSVWGFSHYTKDNLPLGREIQGELSSTTTIYEATEKHLDGKNPWNKKPKVNVNVFQLPCSGAGLGFSGAPVWEPNRGKIVGMFVSLLNQDPHRDSSIEGYVIPIDVVIKFQDNKVVSSSGQIDTVKLLDEGNRAYYSGNYSKAKLRYDKITKDPNYYHAWYNQGMVYRTIGKRREAAECFDIAEKIKKAIDRSKKPSSSLKPKRADYK